LSERVAGYQRRECEAAMADLLDVTGDLREVGGVDAAPFYNEDGTLNEAELRAAAGALIAERPRLGKPPEPRWQNFGQYPSPPPGRLGWDSVPKQ
jgi:hypothetical protein